MSISACLGLTSPFKRFVQLITLASMIAACAPIAVSEPTLQQATQVISTQAIPQETLITFRITLPNALPPGDSIFLTTVDEVTGLAFHTTEFIMTAEDATHYSVIIPFQVGAVVKYRYMRRGTTTVNEHLPNGLPVRYRLYHVEGPGVVQDTISRWTDTYFLGNTGRIQGLITNSQSGEPIPSLLVSVGGALSFTKADGRFQIDGLPEGTHNLVAYSIGGMFTTYQQGARIAPNSTTPATFSLTASPTVSVVFSVTVPPNTPSEAPLRLAGNLYQLGNTYADLSGGVSTLASRMPVMNKLPDGRYVVALTLPVGAYIEYKYTLGDGLWNAEHTVDGSHLTRHLIVPGANTQINDNVSNWGTIQIAPIRFDVAVPSYTPSTEGVSIQFNPGFGWLQPIPMWSAAGTQGEPIWRFILISPLEVLGAIQYRICRADQCGLADDHTTWGNNPIGNIVNPSSLPQTIFYTVSDWAWLQSTQQQASIPNVAIQPHGSDFIAGIEFDSAYNPSWSPHVNEALIMVNNLGANWLILRPTWSFTSTSLPILDIVPSQDILLPDLLSYVTEANNLGLNIGLYPTPKFPLHPDQWWYDSPRDFSWWVIWFDQYTQFILHHADIASQNDVDALILGGDWVLPALTLGKLVDETSSGVPADAEQRWRTLIDQIRSRYQGNLIWALPYPAGIQAPPLFIDEFDKVIVQWSAPLNSSENPSVDELSTEAARILDQDILPLSQSTGKPVILSIAYPSAHRSATGCIPKWDGQCIPVGNLSTTNPDIADVSLDLQGQADLYNAIFLSVNQRDWIAGVISMGFFPPVTLQDPSISVYSKPAGGVLWYWFPRLSVDQP